MKTWPDGERVEPGHAVHERGLARARRAHDRGEAPVAEVDRHVVEGAHLGVARAVDLGGVQRAGGGHGRSREEWGRSSSWLRTVPGPRDREHEGCPRGDQGHPDRDPDSGVRGGPPVDSGAVTCPSCRADVPAGARFCADCGQDLRLRGDERRIVTVLFADLVGYTTLSETRDPEQVKNLIDGCFERLVADIDAFGGRVDKIIGDAIVALFGAPTAHEDDAERAVRAALRMQETLAAHTAELDVDIRMRVGVNTGEVLVGALRAGGDYTAMGDVVNTANRLQAAAAAGRGARRPGDLRRHPSHGPLRRPRSRSTPRAARSSCRRGGPTAPSPRPGTGPSATGRG